VWTINAEFNPNMCTCFRVISHRKTGTGKEGYVPSREVIWCFYVNISSKAKSQST
jgi:hypothetical protein